MKYIPRKNTPKYMTFSAGALLFANLAFGVTPNDKTFQAGIKADVKGVIISHDGSTLRVRGDDDAVETVDLSNSTKIQLKHGVFGRKTAMDGQALVPGLHIEAQGTGSDRGSLVAEKVIFDPNSMRASRQIDTRVSPLEARQGSLEGRAGTLETRAGQMEGRQSSLETTEKQTQQQVGQVKTSADQANQGVNDVNSRVTNLDNYNAKFTATVYFRTGSAVLTEQGKTDLADVAQKAKGEKGYVVEVAGFADKTGSSSLNQDLSERRANAVIHYLEEEGDIPVHRILAPAGLGVSHEAADNKSISGRKLNRRVEVKVLVNQGLTALNGQGPTGPSTATPPAPTPQ